VVLVVVGKNKPAAATEYSPDVLRRFSEWLSRR
jgi:hypothetical protein